MHFKVVFLTSEKNMFNILIRRKVGGKEGGKNEEEEEEGKHVKK